MSELDDIRARRAAITPGVWEDVYADATWIKKIDPNYAGISGCYFVEADGDYVARLDLPDDYAERNAAFIAAAPADIDALLRMVESQKQQMDALNMWCDEFKRRADALTAERDEYRTAYMNEQKLSGSYHVLWQQQEDSLARLTAERDALAAQLAQAQLAIVEAGMVDMTEVFFPYQLVNETQTVYEVMQRKLLTVNEEAQP